MRTEALGNLLRFLLPRKQTGTPHNHDKTAHQYGNLPTGERAEFWDKHIAPCQTCQTILGRAVSEAPCIHNEFQN